MLDSKRRRGRMDSVIQVHHSIDEAFAAMFDSAMKRQSELHDMAQVVCCRCHTDSGCGIGICALCRRCTAPFMLCVAKYYKWSTVKL